MAEASEIPVKVFIPVKLSDLLNLDGVHQKRQENATLMVGLQRAEQILLKQIASQGDQRHFTVAGVTFNGQPAAVLQGAMLRAMRELGENTVKTLMDLGVDVDAEGMAAAEKIAASD